MRRICLSVMILAMIFALAGCGGRAPVAGEEFVMAAREAYAALDSAHVEVVNDSTGEAEQTFIFKCDEKGMMTYSYVGVSDGTRLAQFNNGYEQFTDENGEVSYTDSQNLRFTAYSKDVRYPMADAGLIIFLDSAIDSEKCSVTEKDGITEVIHVYDPKTFGLYDGEGELKAFSALFRFDENGELISLTELADIVADGIENRHSYTIYITERNSVARVENVVNLPSEE